LSDKIIEYERGFRRKGAKSDALRQQLGKTEKVEVSAGGVGSMVRENKRLL